MLFTRTAVVHFFTSARIALALATDPWCYNCHSWHSGPCPWA